MTESRGGRGNAGYSKGSDYIGLPQNLQPMVRIPRFLRAGVPLEQVPDVLWYSRMPQPLAGEYNGHAVSGVGRVPNCVGI